MASSPLAPLKQQARYGQALCERLLKRLEMTLEAEDSGAEPEPPAVPLYGSRESALSAYIKLAQLMMKWHEHTLMLLREEEKRRSGTVEEMPDALSAADWGLIAKALKAREEKGNTSRVHQKI